MILFDCNIMAKKKKSTKRVKPVITQTPQPVFMGLDKAQTRSLAVGVIIVGIGLFLLSGYTWTHKKTLGTVMFQPNEKLMLSPKPSKRPPLQMISATSTARMTEKNPLIKKLSNTSSKVTYTVQDQDSLATIGEKLCHSDRAWLSIAITNQLTYPYIINPGETYIITCN